MSRMALQAGETGTGTRVVQRQIVALLEKMLAGQKDRIAGMGLPGMRLLAMMQMMASPGMRPGSFLRGTNAQVLPASLEEAQDDEWRRARSRFGEELRTGFEAQYPPEFRGLLSAYFDRLRRELPR